MELTNLQEEVMDYLALSNLFRRAMYKTTHQLGYTSRVGRYYDIHVANDTGSEEVETIVLLHELGHVYYGHNDADHIQELKDIKKLCVDMNIPFKAAMKAYGGPMRFLNLAMDLEINTKLLTIDNVKKMYEFGFGIIIPKAMKVDLASDFRSYYKPLLENIKFDENDSENSELGDDFSNVERNNTGDDLSGTPMTTGDPEIDEALADEGYVEGDAKASKSDDVDDITTVGDAKKENDEKEGDSGSKGKGRGKSHGLSNSITVDPSKASEEITRLLKSIVKDTTTYKIDWVKRYNRGTYGRSNGILYPSVVANTTPKKTKLAVLVDVSGSMKTESIVTAVSSLKECSRYLDRNSMFVTWDTDLCEEYSILEVPDKIRSGGGTDIVKGIEYLINNGYKNIVVYSDFDTSNLDKVDTRRNNFYAICVKDYYEGNTEANFFFKGCKKCIFIRKEGN